MKIFTVLFLFSISVVRAVIMGTPASEQDYNLTELDDNNMEAEISMENIMKSLRIQMIKLQISTILNLKEVPPSVQGPSEVSKETIKNYFIEEEKEWIKKQERLLVNEEQFIIHAKKSNQQCLHSNETYCRMYQFELNQSLNTTSVDLWIYKQTEKPEWISVSLSSPTSSDKRQYEILYYEVDPAGWSKLDLQKILIPPSSKHSSYEIEIIGQNIEYIGEHRPFLLASKLALTPSRKRRDLECNTKESCCLRPFRVSFADIGLDWILYPSEIEANFCVGKCNRDPSTVSTHYGLTMLKLLQSNSKLKDSLGECCTLCCKPKKLEPVRLLVNDTQGMIHDFIIPDLKVKSCGCS